MLRVLQKALALTALALACIGAHAQTYPSKPVTLIVPFAAGGANDTVARPYAQKMSQNLGQQFVVDNRPGAGGNIGAQLAAKAPKDGYTLMLTLGTTLTANPWLYKKVPFDSIKDFEPITPIATAPYVLVVNPSFPAKSVKELIDFAKAKPGQLNYASAGNGTPNHLLGEMLKTVAGIDIVHVPYKGAAAALTDVVGGQVPMAFNSMPSAIPFMKGGQLRVLGVAQEKRTPLAPDIPAIAEMIPGFGALSWYGLLAPAGTPKEIIAKLHAESVKVLNDKEVKEKMAAQGAEVWVTTPEQFAAFIKEDLAKWAKIVKASGAQID
jgi:tripartite-type tricarboxylate transporter receptor subunit TctC